MSYNEYIIECNRINKQIASLENKILEYYTIKAGTKMDIMLQVIRTYKSEVKRLRHYLKLLKKEVEKRY